jgi:hypothetical protein
MIRLSTILALGYCLAATTANADDRLQPWPLRADSEASWGERVADAEKVFQSAAEQLRPYFPQRQLSPILVRPKGGPMVKFRRGPQGEYTVLLNTGDRLWAQHAYQFAHELAHILANYTPQEHPHRWFEESLCELASLFTLRRMAARWATDPPYPNWRDYAPALADYANERIKAAQLPPGKSLAAWYPENAVALSANACLRDKNTTVAAMLLPLFEASPESWETIAFLNPAEPHQAKDLGEFLTGWQARVPDRHKPFVQRVAAQFDLKAPARTGPAQ